MDLHSFFYLHNLFLYFFIFCRNIWKGYILYFINRISNKFYILLENSGKKIVSNRWAINLCVSVWCEKEKCQFFTEKRRKICLKIVSKKVSISVNKFEKYIFSNFFCFQSNMDFPLFIWGSKYILFLYSYNYYDYMFICCIFDILIYYIGSGSC